MQCCIVFLIYFYTSALLHYCPTVEEGGDGGGAVVGGDEPAVPRHPAVSPLKQPGGQVSESSNIPDVSYTGNPKVVAPSLNQALRKFLSAQFINKYGVYKEHGT